MEGGLASHLVLGLLRYLRLSRMPQFGFIPSEPLLYGWVALQAEYERLESLQAITLRAGTANLDYTQNSLLQSFLQIPLLT